MRWVACMFVALLVPTAAVAQEAEPPIEPYSGGAIVVTSVGVDPGFPTDATAGPGSAATVAGTAATTAASTAPVSTAASPDVTAAQPTPTASTLPAPPDAPIVTSGTQGEEARITAATTASVEAAEETDGSTPVVWLVAGAVAILAVAVAAALLARRRRRETPRTIA